MDNEFAYRYCLNENLNEPELKITLIPDEVRENTIQAMAIVLVNCITVAEVYNGKEVPIDDIEDWKLPIHVNMCGSVVLRFPNRNVINSYLLLLKQLGII